jgi:cytochrome c-type protein NapB
MAVAALILHCHVVASDPRPAVEHSKRPGNTFIGLASAGVGKRAWPGAPPTMPHRLWMRDQCASCHGPAGHAGSATSHPARQSCHQCHVPSAALEQRFPTRGEP